MSQETNENSELSLGGRGPLSRRSLLKGAGATALGVGVAGALASCSSGGSKSTAGTGTDASGGSSGSGSGGTNEKVSMGSNRSNKVDRDALAEVIKAYEGGDVDINTTESEEFQNNINTYLEGNPDPLFTWFAGSVRMRNLVQAGLSSDVEDVWADIGDGYSGGFAQQAEGDDGKKYFVPFYNYPWGVYYRPSIFEEKGYEVPTTWTDWLTLNEQMKSDGLTPISFANGDGWPGEGTFDYICLRQHGKEFRDSLMLGNESWTSPEVKEIFSLWEELIPFYLNNFNSLTWEEGAQSFWTGESAQYVIGLFVTGQAEASGADSEDLDFFEFPEINPEWGQDTIMAPIDGFMLSAGQEDNTAAKELLKYLGSSKAQDIYNSNNPGWIPLNKGANRDAMTPLDKKGAEVMEAAEYVVQFVDRDTLPEFNNQALIPGIQEFLTNPGDIDNILTTIEEQKVAFFQ